ncbi:MAG: LamG domain-containing protein [bacterium]|nr:LamG domain-containing protein [bacterium]
MKKLLLLVFLMAPMLVAQEVECPKGYPPDTCDAAIGGVSPVGPDLTDAVECWNLNEGVGATRVNDCSANDLTEGTGDNVSVIAGRDGNGVQSSLAPVACLTATAVNLGSEWTMSFWFPTDISGEGNFSGIVNGDTLGLQTLVNDLGGLDIRIGEQAGGGSVCLVSTTEFGPTVDATFSLFIAWRSASNGKLHCNVNNGTVKVSNAVSAASYTPTGSFYASGLGCSFPFGLQVDEIAIFDREISDAERNALLTTFAPY